MKWFLFLTLFSSQSLYASSADPLAFLFYQNKISFQGKSFQSDEQCHPQPGSTSCVEVICSKLPSYECDSPSEIATFAAACRGNINGDCVSAVIKALPSYESDSSSEMTDIAKQCSQVYGSSCLNIFKNKLPSYEYDTKNEIYEILSHCGGASYDAIECTKFTCNKLPSYECDSKSEIYQILKSCGN